MKFMTFKWLGIAMLLLLFNCKSDDDNTNDPPMDNTQELIDNLISAITNDEQSVWKIESATLTNNSVTDLDVSNAFNIIDDEFAFKTVSGSNTITLEHKQGNAFNENADDTQSFLLDYYKSAENFTLEITDIDTKTFGSDTNSFTYNSENSLNGTLTLANGSLSINLSPKIASDYAAPPTNGLNFSEAFIYESNGVSGMAPGMIGSYSDNSLFIVTREDALNQGNGSPERVVKFNLNDGTSTEKLFFHSDFVSKQLHIQNNQLIAFGAQYVNTYDLDIVSDPTSVNHGKQLSRHGITVQDNDMYVIGGDLNEVESNKILKWDIANQSITEAAVMPDARSGARATIVDGKMYIFGGSEQFYSDPAYDTYFVYDTANDSFETKTMPKALNFTFVDRYQNLIYVAGLIIGTNDQGESDQDLFVGVLNTEDGTFQELSTNLDDSDLRNTIHGMCVFNGKMYVIYGGLGVDNGGLLSEWSIMTADL